MLALDVSKDGGGGRVNHGRPDFRGIGGRQGRLERGQDGLGVGGSHGEQ